MCADVTILPIEKPVSGEAVAVAPGVLWVRMPLPFALDHINLWLLDDGDGRGAGKGGGPGGAHRAQDTGHWSRDTRHKTQGSDNGSL